MLDISQRNEKCAEQQAQILLLQRPLLQWCGTAAIDDVPTATHLWLQCRRRSTGRVLLRSKGQSPPPKAAASVDRAATAT